MSLLVGFLRDALRFSRTPLTGAEVDAVYRDAGHPIDPAMARSLLDRLNTLLVVLPAEPVLRNEVYLHSLRGPMRAAATIAVGGTVPRWLHLDDFVADCYQATYELISNIHHHAYQKKGTSYCGVFITPLLKDGVRVDILDYASRLPEAVRIPEEIDPQSTTGGWGLFQVARSFRAVDVVAPHWSARMQANIAGFTRKFSVPPELRGAWQAESATAAAGRE